MKKDLPYYTSLATIISTLLFLIYFFFLSLYPFEILNLQKFDVLTDRVVAGEPIDVYLSFKKKIDYTPTIKWSLVDGFIYGIPREFVILSVGENNVKTYLEIPKSTPSGTYHLQAHIEFQITPFRTINYVWKSNEFTVINSKRP